MQQLKANQGFWLYQSLGWSLFALVQLLVLTSDEALSWHNALPALLLLLLAFSGCDCFFFFLAAKLSAVLVRWVIGLAVHCC